MRKPVAVLVVVAAVLVGLHGPADAQTQPSAGKIQGSAIPDLIEVSDGNLKLVGYARKADVLNVPASGIIDVYDRAGTKRVGRLHPNGSGYVPNGKPVPAQKNKPIIHSGGPSVASFSANPEAVVKGHMYDDIRDLHFCGAAHAQIGNGGTPDMAWGAVVVRPILWFGGCALNTTAQLGSGYLAVQLVMVRNGQICGQTEWQGNPDPTWVFGFTAKPCTNPFGSQSWVAVGNSRFYEESTNTAWNGTAVFSPTKSY